jgi:bifunctional ADP-heptose synthase (sugar kinase/adenylyltransferase)
MTISLSAPIVTVAQARAACTHWTRDRRPILLAIGAYDLLHVDLVQQLAAVKPANGVVVVAVLDDVAAEAHLPSGRPLMPHEDRLALVAAWRAADLVVSVTDDDVATLGKTLGATMILHPDESLLDGPGARIRERARQGPKDE